ncbi:MAG TPA: hypothetical protein VIK91_11820 [Nannocystis sp.]
MFRAAFVLVLAALVSAAPACKNSGSPPPAGSDRPQTPRVPLVPMSHEFYKRLEGITFKNDCEDDAGCFRGGCSGEICTAQSDVMGTCEVLPVQIPATARCGCVEGECMWYSDGSAQLVDMRKGEPPGESSGEPPGEPPAEQPSTTVCGDRTCAPGEQCIEYYGVAGPRGPKFQTCGIPCKAGKCPDGKRCVTIADGPGPVCQ